MCTSCWVVIATSLYPFPTAFKANHSLFWGTWVLLSPDKDPGSGQRPSSAENSHGVADSVTTAPSAPRSGALAAPRLGGLRPGSLRVHDPCNEGGHGSRLGFPGRRLPRGPPPLPPMSPGARRRWCPAG